MNRLESTLENIGKGFVKILSEVDKVGVIAEPFVDLAFPSLAAIYNAAANGAATARSAGEAAIKATNTPEQNLAAAAIAVEPVLVQFAASAGLSAPTTATILAYAQALLASMKIV